VKTIDNTQINILLVCTDSLLILPLDFIKRSQQFMCLRPQTQREVGGSDKAQNQSGSERTDEP
jgi:hypothetical protein